MVMATTPDRRRISFAIWWTGVGTTPGALKSAIEGESSKTASLPNSQPDDRMKFLPRNICVTTKTNRRNEAPCTERRSSWKGLATPNTRTKQQKPLAESLELQKKKWRQNVILMINSMHSKETRTRRVEPEFLWPSCISQQKSD